MGNEAYAHYRQEERYKKEIELPGLEERKKALSDLRNFHKPIVREEIDDFEKDYQEKRRLKIDQKRIEREKWYNDIGSG